MLNVFLDDTRQPINAYNETADSIYVKEKWALVKDFDEFCTYVETIFYENKSLPKIFSFDHNLAPEHYANELINYDSYKEKTGYHCALWLKDFCDKNKLDYPEVYSHSASYYGRRNILSVFYPD
ncbi:MAG: cyclic-phosphate processing receiver domain-containing protein [Candidatus Sericytochromatia bacterium]